MNATRAGIWLVAGALLLGGKAALAFDHAHTRWTLLLREHVAVAAEGHASAVRYARILNDRANLDTYLGTLSSVTANEFSRWSNAEQLGFLINAYNAFTVRLILGHYPGIDSIRDIGTWFRSPWKKKFFTLLGERRSLHDVEHAMIRRPGRFDEPRIHFALVCASKSCPMLRPEAFTAERLDYQLDDSMCRFLGRKAENRFDARAGLLRVSSIFKWYEQDFMQGHAGITSPRQLFSTRAHCITPAVEEQQQLHSGEYELEYQDYDWRLNDAGHMTRAALDK